MGTIDPDVAVEAVAAGPQAGDFAVPPLVRRQRRVEERDAQRDREQDERERRWGPPAGDVSRGTMIGAYVALSAVLAVAVWQLGLGLTPERYLLVLLVPALILRQVKAYLVDFVPFALLLVFYSTCRGLAHMVNPTPFYAPQLEAERFLFGGQLPTTELQHLLGWSRAGLNARIAVESGARMVNLPCLVSDRLGCTGLQSATGAMELLGAYGRHIDKRLSMRRQDGGR